MAESVRLLDQLRHQIRLRHYSYRTEQSYVGWVRRFIRFHNLGHPASMGAAEVERFLSYLATERKVAAAMQAQALSAILFLYKVVLKIELPWLDNVVRASRPRHLPVVLTQAETRAVLSHLQGTAWLIAGLLYGSGLRVLEALRLRVKDIDLDIQQITVRDGKGSKDRVTVLPTSLIDPLRVHLARMREQHAQASALRACPEIPGCTVGLGMAVRISVRASIFRPTQRHAAEASHTGKTRTACGAGRCAAGSNIKACLSAHLQAQLCDALARGGLRHSHGSGTAGP